jgi:hypothetical protein
MKRIKNFEFFFYSSIFILLLIQKIDAMNLKSTKNVSIDEHIADHVKNNSYIFLKEEKINRIYDLIDMRQNKTLSLFSLINSLYEIEEVYFLILIIRRVIGKNISKLNWA